jgi:hypothetical protein
LTSHQLSQAAIAAASTFVHHQPAMQINHRAHLLTNVVKVDVAHLASAHASQITNGASHMGLQIRYVAPICVAPMGDANAYLKESRALLASIAAMI